MRLRPFAAPPASAFDAWRGRAPSFQPGTGRARHVDRDEVAAPWSAEAFARGRDAMLRYDLYPPALLRHRVDAADGRVGPGALIVQRIPAPLLALEAGVRVVAFEDGPARVAYTYVTLQGHPERGAATFTLACEAERIVFRIESESGPGLAVTQLLRSYARRRQREAVAAALARMRAQLS